MLDDDDIRRELAEHALAKARTLSIEQVVDYLETVYRSLLRE